VGLREFDAPTTLRALVACIDALQLDIHAALSDEDRGTLLEFWQAADLTAEDLLLLKRLPLFEQEGQRNGGRLFVAIDSHAWYMLPEDIPSSDLRGDFLAHKANVADIYERLGVQPLTREKLYCNFIFEEIRQGTLAAEERARHLHDISVHYDQLALRSEEFKHALAQLAFVPVRSSDSLVTPSNCFDPRNPLFVQFFADSLALRETPAGWPSTALNWLIFLEKCGMICDFSAAVFMDCARRVSAEATAQPLSALSEVAAAELRSRASRLSRYLMESSNIAAFAQELDQPGAAVASADFFEDLSKLSLAEPMRPLFVNRCVSPAYSIQHACI
jgi:hypothetical protein